MLPEMNAQPCNSLKRVAFGPWILSPGVTALHGNVLGVPASPDELPPGLTDNPFVSTYAVYAIVALVAIFLFLLLLLVFRRARFGRAGESGIGMTLDDVGTLQQKGLLTPEEMKRVREALSRQVVKQYSVQQGPKSGANALLHDPEVRRLEVLADAKAREKERMLAARQEPPVPQFTLKTEASDALIPEPNGDVELPPDVLTMVQLGLITADELERIKERIRAKHSGQS